MLPALLWKFVRVSCGSNDSWSYAILMISPPPSRGRSGGGSVPGVRSQKSEKKSDRHFMVRYREKRRNSLSDRHALYVSQYSFAARAPIPTLALPLKGTEYSAAGIHSKIRRTNIGSGTPARHPPLRRMR